MDEYADAIIAISIVDGDPEVYFREFEKSLSLQSSNLKTVAVSISSVSPTNSNCKLFLILGFLGSLLMYFEACCVLLSSHVAL